MPSENFSPSPLITFPYKEVLSESQIEQLSSEFGRLENSVYLDHAGATLYAKSQLDAAFHELKGNLFSNPHSRSPASSFTTDAIDNVRQRVLQHFETNEEEYSLIFTSGATAGLKILAESFAFNGGVFAYLEDNHTSVIGMREYLTKTDSPSHSPLQTSSVCGPEKGSVYCLSRPSMEGLMTHFQTQEKIKPNTNANQNHDSNPKHTKNALFAYPAQCNFSGYKYPLSWIKAVKDGALNPILDEENGSFYIHSFHPSASLSPSPNSSDGENLNWYVVLDAASYVATNKLDLSQFKPDFVVLSFYKMFGWPTGLGALLVRQGSESLLSNKRYFGGGTVNISLPSEPFHVKRFEDGTISFLSILSIRHGLDSINKFFPTMDHLKRRTFSLIQYLYKNLSSLKYSNGQRVARIYADTGYESEDTQGPLLAFNLLRPNGDIIGYSEMEQIAYLHKLNLRYGCFCNPGACRRHLGLSSHQVLKHYEAGHVCGDMRDIIDGHPTGAIRASVGYMTRKEEVDFLLHLIYSCWVKPYNENQLLLPFPKFTPTPTKNRTLSRIFIYPIKSCAPFEVKGTWLLGPLGLLYDREWLIINSSGVPLTTKREPRLCLIQPTIDISKRQLSLHFEGSDAEQDVAIPLDIEKSNYSSSFTQANLCNSKVCGDTIVGIDAGPKVSAWLNKVLDKSDLKLIRKDPTHHRKPRNSLDEISLSNQSQFLLLSIASLRQLGRELISARLLSSLNIPLNGGTNPGSQVRGRGNASLNYGDGTNGQLEIIAQELSCGNPDVVDEASEPEVEELLVESLIRRFRGNFVVAGGKEDEDEPYGEEDWDQVRIGASLFRSGGPCVRCATICMDPITGEKSSEPLLTLSRTRGGRPNFGLHLYSEKKESQEKAVDPEFFHAVRIGDKVEVLNYRSTGKGQGESQVEGKNKLSGMQLLDNID